MPRTSQRARALWVAGSLVAGLLVVFGLWLGTARAPNTLPRTASDVAPSPAAQEHASAITVPVVVDAGVAATDNAVANDPDAAADPIDVEAARALSGWVHGREEALRQLEDDLVTFHETFDVVPAVRDEIARISRDEREQILALFESGRTGGDMMAAVEQVYAIREENNDRLAAMLDGNARIGIGLLRRRGW